MLGDLLISGPERTDAVPSIPSAGAVTNVFPLGSGFSIRGLKQKIHILSSDCAIAWAGTEIYAKAAMKDLRKLANSNGLNLATIQKYFSENRNDIDDHVQFLGWIREPHGIIKFNYPPLSPENYQSFNDVCTVGTGSTHFRELIPNLPANPARSTIARTPMRTAVFSSVYAVGEMMLTEVVMQNNLIEYFGGGWEVAIHDGQRFQKIGDVTFLFWIAEKNATGLDLPSPQLVLKQDYVDDILRLRVARRSEKQIYSHECHFASPIDAITRDDEKRRLQSLPLPNLNSPLLCHCVLVKTDGKLASFTRIEVSSGPGTTSTIFIENPKGMSVAVKREFTESVLESVNDALKR